MAHVVEADETGRVVLPGEWLGNPSPGRRFVVEVLGDTVLLHPEGENPYHEGIGAEGRVESLMNWLEGVRGSMSDVTPDSLRRVNLYE